MTFVTRIDIAGKHINGRPPQTPEEAADVALYVLQRDRDALATAEAAIAYDTAASVIVSLLADGALADGDKVAAIAAVEL